MITLATVPRRAADVLAREVGAELIFLAPDGREVHAVNEVGAAVWSLIDGARSLTAIRDDICRRFDVTPVRCSCDLLEFVRELADRGLVTVER